MPIIYKYLAGFSTKVRHELCKVLYRGMRKSWQVVVIKFVVFQLLSCVWLFVTPWTAAHQASLSFTISWSLLRFVSIELTMPSNYLIFCHPLLLLPSIFPGNFPNVFPVSFPMSWFFVHQVAKVLELQLLLGNFFICFCFCLSRKIFCTFTAKDHIFSI